MRRRKNIITVAIDSPAAAGAGTQAKLIARQYNLIHLDTGRIYRLIGKMKLENPSSNLVSKFAAPEPICTYINLILIIFSDKH